MNDIPIWYFVARSIYFTKSSVVDFTFRKTTVQIRRSYHLYKYFRYDIDFTVHNLMSKSYYTSKLSFSGLDSANVA